MTQIASFDLGAVAARRQQASPSGAPKNHGDFMSAIRHAASEARKQERTQDADRAESRVERDRDAKPADEAPQAEAHEQAEKTPKAEQAHQADQKPKAEQAPQAEQTTQAEKPAEPKAEQTPATESTEAPATEAPQAEVPTETQPTALDAQAVLALQLATGGQVAQPVTVTATAAQVETAVQAELTAVQTAQTQAQTAAQATDAETQQAIAQALQKAQAEAKGQTEAKAQANGLQHAQAPQVAAAQAQAQSPAFLQQAARDLGPITMQVTQQTAQVETPVAPVVVPTAEAQPTESGNLAIQLLDAKVQEAAKGPIAPVTMLDGADGTEMPSQPVTLLTDEDEAALPTLDTDAAPMAPAIAGERGVAETAKAVTAEKAEAPVRAQDVMPQVSKHLEQLKANQANSIKLQLYPEHLGKMEIKVVSHQGVLSAQLTADSQSVKAMLETQVASLQRTFAELGLKVDKVEVTLSSSNLNFDSQGQQTAAQQGEQQQFGRQPSSQNTFNGSGYQQWLGDDPADETVYASLDTSAAVNYVA